MRTEAAQARMKLSASTAQYRLVGISPRVDEGGQHRRGHSGLGNEAGVILTQRILEPSMVPRYRSLGSGRGPLLSCN